MRRYLFVHVFARCAGIRIIPLVIFFCLMVLVNMPASAQSDPAPDEEGAATQTIDTTLSGDAVDGGQTSTADPSSAGFLEIKKIEGKEDLFVMELRDVELGDLFRLVAQDYKLNILIDKDVAGQVTASLSNVSLEEALETIADMHSLIIEKKKNIMIVKPHFVTRVFVLKHIEAKILLDSGNSDSSDPTATASDPSSTLNNLLSAKGKALLGKYPNSIMVIDLAKNVEEIAEYVEMVDKGMVSRVFNLKYISAREVVLGVSSSSTDTSAATTTADSTEAAPTAAP